jgi:4-amino-4-deoxy-L-arabinose transferase-like glycosyltransferase
MVIDRAGALHIALLCAIAWFITLPLNDVLRYPQRLAVLQNLQVDAATYQQIARAVAGSWTLQAFPVLHPPLWPTLLALVYQTFGVSIVAGKLISWLALIGSVLLTALIARRVHNTAAAWTAALLCASSPGLRAYVGTLQYEVTTAFLALAALGAAMRAAESTERARLLVWASITGLTSAALILTREPFAVVVPAIATWIAERVRHVMGLRQGVMAAAVMLVLAAVPAIVWSAAQSIRDGRLIVISAKGAMVMDFGNNPRANGTFNATLAGVGQPSGFAFVRDFPRRTLVLAVRKVLYFWGVLRDGWNVPQPAAVWIWRASTALLPLTLILPVVRGGWLLAAFVVAIAVLGRHWLRQWWILPAIVILTMTVYVVSVSSYRFAVPVLPIIYIIVSQPIAALAMRAGLAWRQRSIAAAAALLLSCVIGMQFVQWPFHFAAARGRSRRHRR